MQRDLLAFVQSVYFPQNFRISSDSTRKHYRLCIKDLAAVLGRDPLVEDLTEENICKALRHVAARVDSAHTVEQRRHYLVALANWCSRRGILPHWVSVQKYPTPEVEPTAWTKEQLERLWEACRLMEGTWGGILVSHWWQAFHAVLWDSGERTGAVLAIEVEWIDFKTGELRIPAKARKGRKKGMTYHLKPRTVELLRAMVCGRQLVFTGCGSIDKFYYQYNRLLKQAGLPTDRRSKPQRMRRSFASHLEAAGGDATEALSHTSRTITKKHYLDEAIIKRPPPNLLLPAIDKLGAWLAWVWHWW